MLKLGNMQINKLYLGSTEINKVYLGNQVIFQKDVLPPISGYLLHLHADRSQITGTGNNASVIFDLSGNNFNGIGPAGFAPQTGLETRNGKNVLKLSGGQRIELNYAPLLAISNQNYTAYVVIKMNAYGAFNRILVSGSSSLAFLIDQGGGRLINYNNTGFINAATKPNGSNTDYRALSAIRNGSVLNVAINGELGSAGVAVNFTSSQLTISSDGDFINANLCEVLIYGTAHTVEEQLIMQQYFASEWLNESGPALLWGDGSSMEWADGSTVELNA